MQQWTYHQGYPVVQASKDNKGRVHLRQAPFSLQVHSRAGLGRASSACRPACRGKGCTAHKAGVTRQLGSAGKLGWLPGGRLQLVVDPHQVPAG